MTAAKPPGWYPDPQDPSEQRYWDGTRWVERAVHGSQHIDEPGSPSTPASQAPSSAGTLWRWLGRHRTLSGILAASVVLTIAGAVATSGTDEHRDERSRDDTAGHGRREPEKKNDGAVSKSGTFGDGDYRVGQDVPVGTYRSSKTTDECYWATLKSSNGGFDDIIDNGNHGPAIVTIRPSARGFESRGCGEWVAVEGTFPSEPWVQFGDGAYIVGEHIEPGQYRSNGKAGEYCYWARVSNFRGGGIDGIISVGYRPELIEIQPGDAGFFTYECGTWSK
jgi:Protein of unknown function (DUF2510)